MVAREHLHVIRVVDTKWDRILAGNLQLVLVVAKLPTRDVYTHTQIQWRHQARAQFLCSFFLSCQTKQTNRHLARLNSTKLAPNYS